MEQISVKTIAAAIRPKLQHFMCYSGANMMNIILNAGARGETVSGKANLTGQRLARQGEENHLERSCFIIDGIVACEREKLHARFYGKKGILAQLERAHYLIYTPSNPLLFVAVKNLVCFLSVFALHHYKPTPLYVMDEIDAALDFKNVSIVGHYVKDRAKDAQFIIIRERNRELIKEAIHVRYALLPYLYTLFREANSIGVPVCKGFNERAKHALVYLPGEQSWYDLRSGAMYKGGVTHKLEVTEEIILFSKELETLLHVVL
ncbi:hypothetical protein VNO78_02176 [Psophocarpus tetragonolobus]|uniref:RecF/RecN/SMC N-terminal domain-containing protein n=1 Tax=Psophocarpus tetragonolobus TaxID=3891 RepID=A0AAN9TA93_PSOTE